jgi:hypothetical protein
LNYLGHWYSASGTYSASDLAELFADRALATLQPVAHR